MKDGYKTKKISNNNQGKKGYDMLQGRYSSLLGIKLKKKKICFVRCRPSSCHHQNPFQTRKMSFVCIYSHKLVQMERKEVESISQDETKRAKEKRWDKREEKKGGVHKNKSKYKEDWVKVVRNNKNGRPDSPHAIK